MGGAHTQDVAISVGFDGSQQGFGKRKQNERIIGSVGYDGTSSLEVGALRMPVAGNTERSTLFLPCGMLWRYLGSFQHAI